MNSNLRNLDLNLLVVFEAIMEERSISASASKLGMTQPAVSSALGRLRSRYKDELFIRNRYGMSPTERALELFHPIKNALSIIRTTVDVSNEFNPETSSRTFKLALSDFGESTLVANLINTINLESQNLRIETSSALSENTFDQLIHGSIDFLFDSKKPDAKQLKHELLAEDKLVVIYRKNHPRIQDEITSKQFFTEKHIIVNHLLGKQTFLEAVSEEKLKKRKVLAQVQYFSSLPQIVAKTDALAVVTARSARHHSLTLPISTSEIPFRTKKIPYYLIWNQSMEVDQGHTWLKKKILEFKNQQ